MQIKFNSFTKWPIFILSIISMGLWFPISIFRKDERYFFYNNFGLDTHRGPEEGDSVEDAWRELGNTSTLRFFHHLNNITHEWTKEAPKRAAKFFPFIIVVELIIILCLVL